MEKQFSSVMLIMFALAVIVSIAAYNLATYVLDKFNIL